MELITFGDSWVYGLGAGFMANKPVKYEEFDKLIKSKEYLACSFRNLIAKRLGIENNNFAKSGSSNQRQFRLASEYFLRDKYTASENSIVLWGITSVYRHEFFNTQTNYYEPFSLTNKQNKLSKILYTNYVSEKVEIENLYYKMRLFNLYFEKQKIKNYWINLFNDYEFPDDINNLLFKGKSLFSLLLNDSEKIVYKKAGLGDFDNKVKRGVIRGILDPYTFHPTKRSHEIMADLIIKEL
jgi:hypothetical protein